MSKIVKDLYIKDKNIDTKYMYQRDGVYWFQKRFSNYGKQYRISLQTRDIEAARLKRNFLLKKWNNPEWEHCLREDIISREGYIYCIVNKSYEGWVKVGMTKYPKERLKQYNSYAPEDNFSYLKKEQVSHYKLLERHLISTFSKYCSQSKSEWFYVNKNKAVEYFLETINTSKNYLLPLLSDLTHSSLEELLTYTYMTDHEIYRLSNAHR